MKIGTTLYLSERIWHFEVLCFAVLFWCGDVGSIALTAEATTASSSSTQDALGQSPDPFGKETAPSGPSSGLPAPSLGVESKPPVTETSTEAPAPVGNPDGEEKIVEKKKVLKIDVGDKVTIKIYPEDQYIKGAEMEVSSEGTITLPLVGRVTIQGLTAREAEQKITDLLAKDYFVNPLVVVEVAERMVEKRKKAVLSLSVFGQVQKPGSYDFPPEGKMTLLQVISKAGGFTDVANSKKIKIIRKMGGKAEVIHANAESIIAGRDPDVDLKPDDVIHVGESFF